MPRLPVSSSDPRSVPRAAVIPLRVPESDAVLSRALQAGEPWAGAALFDRYATHVRRVLVRVMGPDPEIADLLQDVFVAALASIDRLSDPNALKAWLTRTAIFTARGRIRRRTRWRFLRFVGFDELPDPAAPEVDPEQRQALAAVYRLLAQLPINDRIVFALRVLDGMELADVARACGISVATVKRRVIAAERRFTSLLPSEPSLRGWVKGGAP